MSFQIIKYLCSKLFLVSFRLVLPKLFIILMNADIAVISGLMACAVAYLSIMIPLSIINVIKNNKSFPFLLVLRIFVYSTA